MNIFNPNGPASAATANSEQPVLQNNELLLQLLREAQTQQNATNATRNLQNQVAQIFPQLDPAYIQALFQKPYILPTIYPSTPTGLYPQFPLYASLPMLQSHFVQKAGQLSQQDLLTLLNNSHDQAVLAAALQQHQQQAMAATTSQANATLSTREESSRIASSLSSSHQRLSKSISPTSSNDHTQDSGYTSSSFSHRDSMSAPRSTDLRHNSAPSTSQQTPISLFDLKTEPMDESSLGVNPMENALYLTEHLSGKTPTIDRVKSLSFSSGSQSTIVPPTPPIQPLIPGLTSSNLSAVAANLQQVSANIAGLSAVGTSQAASADQSTAAAVAAAAAAYPYSLANFGQLLWSTTDGTELGAAANAVNQAQSAAVGQAVPAPAVPQVDAQSVIKDLFTVKDDVNSVDMIAKMYRNGANYFDASCTWHGQMPHRHVKNPVYSPKVFLGGVPWDITETQLMDTFRQFGSLKIEFPNQRHDFGWGGKGTGYSYLIFDNEKSVKSLLQSCNPDQHGNSGTAVRPDNDYYFRITSKRIKAKDVQVIPWVVSDSQFLRQPQCRADNSRTVFVGALHGMISAEMLANIMNDLFGSVVSAHIDTDKHKYPIGSGRVAFHSQKSYYKAVAAAFVEIKASKFSKKIQIDPYLEDSKCAHCSVKDGPFFCRDCFKYFCRDCFWQKHVLDGSRDHRPVTRNTRQATLLSSALWSHFEQQNQVSNAVAAATASLSATPAAAAAHQYPSLFSSTMPVTPQPLIIGAAPLGIPTSLGASAAASNLASYPQAYAQYPAAVFDSAAAQLASSFSNPSMAAQQASLLAALRGVAPAQTRTTVATTPGPTPRSISSSFSF